MDDFPVMDLFSQFATIDGMPSDHSSRDRASSYGVSPDAAPLVVERGMLEHAEGSAFTASTSLNSDLGPLLTDLREVVYQLFDMPVETTPQS